MGQSNSRISDNSPTAPPGKESISINSGRRVTASISPPTFSKPMEIQTLHTKILFIGKMLSADPACAVESPQDTLLISPFLY
jgi:hypothetical protein